MILELSRGFRHGDEVELTIDKMNERGLGVAFVETVIGPQKMEKRYEVFVRKAIPGDRVRVRIDKTRRKRASATLLEILEPSSLRIEPRCRHFGTREEAGKGCGGCTLQSMRYRHQLAIKERLIKENFQRVGLDPGLVLPLKGMEEPWYYRNKMEFTFGDDAERHFALGLYPSGYKFEILNVQECHLQSEFVSRFVPAMSHFCASVGLEPYHSRRDEGWLRNLTIREGKRTGEVMVELMTSPATEVRLGEEAVDAEQAARAVMQEAQRLASELGRPVTSFYWSQYIAEKGSPTRIEETLLAGAPVLSEEMHLPGEQRLRFEIHPRAFFQPNTLQAEQLYTEVIERAGLLDADNPRRPKTVLDLYCGTGTIGLCLSPYAERVLGIELQPDAVDNARKNAVDNGIDNASFFVGDVGKVLASPEFIEARGESIDLVVVDPPRSGLFDQAIDQILEIAAPTLVYVSCNPKTLADNLVALTEGGYQLEVVQPVDLFPQTYHVENVALLTRKPSF